MEEMKRKKEEKKREEMKRKKEEKKRKKEKRQKKKERQNEAPVNEERKKRGHLVPAPVLTPNTLVPC